MNEGRELVRERLMCRGKRDKSIQQVRASLDKVDLRYWVENKEENGKGMEKTWGRVDERPINGEIKKT